MSRIRVGLAIALVSALGVFATGCGDDEEPAGGGTTPAATTAATETTADTSTAGADTSTAAAGGEGDVAAGKTFFEGACQGCHNEGGTVQGVGPVLAGKGLTADAIKNQIENPTGNVMPKGLASGADLDNVVAFVASIQ